MPRRLVASVPPALPCQSSGGGRRGRHVGVLRHLRRLSRRSRPDLRHRHAHDRRRRLVAARRRQLRLGDAVRLCPVGTDRLDYDLDGGRCALHEGGANSTDCRRFQASVKRHRAVRKRQGAGCKGLQGRPVPNDGAQLVERARFLRDANQLPGPITLPGALHRRAARPARFPPVSVAADATTKPCRDDRGRRDDEPPRRASPVFRPRPRRRPGPALVRRQQPAGMVSVTIATKPVIARARRPATGRQSVGAAVRIGSA